MIKKIISGGQTGADRAALDAAINLGLPRGGWVPKGRIAENGALPEKYRLNEMPTKSYQKCTEQNVIDSDGTVIIFSGTQCAWPQRHCSMPPIRKELPHKRGEFKNDSWGCMKTGYNQIMRLISHRGHRRHG